MNNTTAPIPFTSPLKAHTFVEGTGDFCSACGGTRVAVFGNIGDKLTAANAVHPVALVTSTMATRAADAATILEQIGRAGLMAVGARDIIDLGDGVHFFVGRGRSHKLVVKLAANDTYTVELVRFRRADLTFESRAVRETVYADLLQDVVVSLAGAL